MPRRRSLRACWFSLVVLTAIVSCGGHMVTPDAGRADVEVHEEATAPDVLDAGMTLDVPPTCRENEVVCANACVSLDSDPLHCGTCDASCPAPAHAVARCASGVCNFDCDMGFTRVDGACEPMPPRLLAPLSATIVGRRRPTLRWSLPSGSDTAIIDLCRDRGCSDVIETFEASGTSGTPSNDLPTGAVYWRARSISGSSRGSVTSPTWELFVPATPSVGGVDLGTALDVNGDGFEDIAIGALGDRGGAGSIFIFAGSGTGYATAPTWRLSVAPSGSNANFGNAVSTAGDLDGDGFADLIIGAWFGAGPSGRAFVYSGRASGPSASPDIALDSPDFNGNFGCSVSNAGDVNGDGYGDVLIGSFQANGGAGRTHLYLGSATGIPRMPTRSLSVADVRGFGFPVSSAGDVNGDGLHDVAIGAFDTGPGRGAMFVYLGATDGLAATPIELQDASGNSRDVFGFAVAGVGDTNGDGLADIAAWARPGLDYTGVVFVYDGARGGPSPRPDTVLTTTANPRGLGLSVAVADFDGDGYSDVAATATAYDTTGHVFVYPGGAAGVAPSPSLAFDGTTTMSLFGYSISAAGDLDRDGSAELLIGAAVLDGNAGGAYVFSAGSTTPRRTYVGLTGPDGEFGYAVAGVH